MGSTHMPGAGRGQQRVPGHLELELLSSESLWVLRTELRSSARQQVLLTAEPSLQPLDTHYFFKKYFKLKFSKILFFKLYVFVWVFPHACRYLRRLEVLDSLDLSSRWLRAAQCRDSGLRSSKRT